MNFKLLLLLALFLVAEIAAGQQSERLQIFGGYSFAYIAPCGTQGGSCGFAGTNFQGSISPETGNYSGWNAAATYFYLRPMGITADFAGYYGNLNYTGGSTTSSSTYTMLFGPTFSAKFGRVSPFVHFLFGVESVHLSFISGSGFAWATGGGIDYRLHKHLKIRLGQFDFLGSHTPHNLGNGYSGGFRYSGGLVFSF